MTYAKRTSSGWSALTYGEDITSTEDITASYATVMLWSDAEREAFGVFTVAEPAPPPAGQIEAIRTLVDSDGRPVWAVTYRPAPASESVPLSVSAAQACVILHEDGLLDRVETIVATMPRTVQLWFARANTWERASPYVAGIGLELDLSEADLDDKFRRAARRL